MRIVDGGVVLELLVGDLDPGEVGEDELAAPHLIDIEVTYEPPVLPAGANSVSSKVTWRWEASLSFSSPNFPPTESGNGCGS